MTGLEFVASIASACIISGLGTAMALYPKFNGRLNNIKDGFGTELNKLNTTFKDEINKLTMGQALTNQTLNEIKDNLEDGWRCGTHIELEKNIATLNTEVANLKRKGKSGD